LRTLDPPDVVPAAAHRDVVQVEECNRSIERCQHEERAQQCGCDSSEHGHSALHLDPTAPVRRPARAHLDGSGVDNPRGCPPSGDDGHAVPFEIMLNARTVLVLSLAITCASGAVSRRADASPVVEGNTYYLSPAGDDSNSGTTPDRPWRSF